MPYCNNAAMTLFEHDSDCCEYLGVCIKEDGSHAGKYDLYTCLQGGHRPPTIIARYSDDGPDYYSGLVFAREDRNPVLWEGAKRAMALGILTKEEFYQETGKAASGTIRIESAGTMENGVLTSYMTFEDTDYCPDCEEEMIWDAGERIYYCPNTWEHG